jgi:hypothetical protein
MMQAMEKIARDHHIAERAVLAACVYSATLT